MKTGLVLEGGAMRGMYTAGVLDTFMENNISVDSVVGVSAGALFGVNYISKQKGRVIRYNKRFNCDKNYLGLKPLLKEGNIVNTKYAYYDVPHDLDPFDDEAYKKSPISFYAVVTNMQSGKPEYIKISSVFDQMDTLRASGSMPFVSKPVDLDGALYLDGGISDSIPFEWAMSQGIDKPVIVLTRDMEYTKKPMSKALINIFYRKYPNLAKSLCNRHNVYNSDIEKLKKLEKEGRVFVIRPSKPIDIKKTEKDPEKLQSVYDLGISDCKNSLERLKEYLQ